MFQCVFCCVSLCILLCVSLFHYVFCCQCVLQYWRSACLVWGRFHCVFFCVFQYFIVYFSVYFSISLCISLCVSVFKISLPCSGQMTAEVDVRIQMNISIFSASNLTMLDIKRKKMCIRSKSYTTIVCLFVCLFFSKYQNNLEDRIRAALNKGDQLMSLPPFWLMSS